MNKVNNVSLASFVALVCLCTLSTNAQSALISDGVWKVEKGDTWESILQTLLPKKASQHSGLIKKAKEINKAALGNNGELVQGNELKFPGAKMKSQAKSSVKSGAGKVLASFGDISAVKQDGSKRKLKRGDQVFSGEIVETGANARTQIRFSDRSLLSLRPKTKFVIEEYNFNGEQDGTEKSVYRLVKGSFRTLSGLIGKVNKNNYRVNTPVATIGIRGTHYGLSFCDANCDALGEKRGLVGGVLEGSIVAENESGQIQFGVDQFFHIEDMNSEIELLEQQIGTLFSGVSNGTTQPKNAAETKKEVKEKFDEVVNTATRDVIKELANREDIGELFEQDPDIVEGRIREVIEARLLDSILPGEDASGRVINIAFNAFENENESDVLRFSGRDQSVPLTEVDITENGLNTGGQILARIDQNGSPIFFVVPITNEDQSSLNGNVAIALGLEDDTGDTAPPSGGTVVSAEDQGESQRFSTYWGRWAPSTVTAAVGSETISSRSDLDSRIQVQMPNGLHYIVTDADNVVSNQAQYEMAKQSLLDQQALLGGSSSNVVSFSYTGLGTAPTDANGNVGNLDYANLGLNLVSNQVENLDISASFSSGETYTLGLENGNSVSVNSVVQGENIDLMGNCNGGSCDVDSGGVALDGSANVALITGSGSAGETEIGAALSFSAITDNIDSNPLVGVTGTAVLEVVQDNVCSIDCIDP